MTDTTDIAALRELAFNASMAITRLSANGEECLYAIGEDTQIDKDVELSNQFHKSFNPIVVIYLLDQLEAERQRSAGSEEELHKALHREKAAGRKLLAAQEEIAALKAKLANPVVLPERWKPCDCIDCAYAYDSEAKKKAINEAGFTVKGE